MLRSALVIVLLTIASASSGQATQAELPTDPGMYVEAGGGLTKIIGQIAEFQRSGSSLVSHATVGIKSRKVNSQLLGAHAQNVVSPRAVFYFVPAKQEADTGVNAGDLILIRLEEKPERRQFEIAAHGAWRSSSGISLTHQSQLVRSEVKPGVYKVVPANTLTRGEYALYLARGEGMAAYVYDFGVQDNVSTVEKAESIPSRQPTPKEIGSGFNSMWNTTANPHSLSVPKRNFENATIGIFAEGNPNTRHDGVSLTAVAAGGPSDQVGIKAGDTILAINDHYLYTISELRDEITRHQPGTKIFVRYRRYSTIYDAEVVVAATE